MSHPSSATLAGAQSKYFLCRYPADEEEEEEDLWSCAEAHHGVQIDAEGICDGGEQVVRDNDTVADVLGGGGRYELSHEFTVFLVKF